MEEPMCCRQLAEEEEKGKTAMLTFHQQWCGVLGMSVDEKAGGVKLKIYIFYTLTGSIKAKGQASPADDPFRTYSTCLDIGHIK